MSKNEIIFTSKLIVIDMIMQNQKLILPMRMRPISIMKTPENKFKKKLSN